MPPAACAEVQVAAPLAALPDALLVGAGGAQPAPSRTSPAVIAAVAVIFLLIFRVVLRVNAFVRMCVIPIRPHGPRLDVFCSWSAPTPEARSVLRMARPGPFTAPGALKIR
ncbi:hypothetical protein GCM10009593_44410 [Microlunatus antarcticus]